MPLSHLSSTPTFTVSPISRNQEGERNWRCKERPRTRQSLFRRELHLISFQEEKIRMLKGRKERKRRETLERKGRGVMQCRGEPPWVGVLVPQQSGSVPLLTLCGAGLSAEGRIRAVPSPWILLYFPLPSLPMLTPTSFCQLFLFLSPSTTLLLCVHTAGTDSPTQPCPSGPPPLHGTLWLAAQKDLQSL